MKIIKFVPRENHHNTGRLMRSREPTHFIGVDGEGMDFGSEHRYVLLGCGDKQIENLEGLKYEEIFEFLYSCFKESPHSAFIGFYLGYDFNQWIKTIPMDKAKLLLTSEGMAVRRSQNGKQVRPYPVLLGKWEIDIIPMKRFAIREIISGQDSWKCKEHVHGEWMYICDTGPFWQTSFLTAINPKNWAEPIVSEEEYALIEKGKESRGTAVLDDDMRMYNRLENEILARAMSIVEGGFREAGVWLRKYQWFGPGQAAQAWLKKEKIPKRQIIAKYVPDWFMEAACKSYVAGWFEITAHGIVKGTSHEYDINSAYPYILASLPCLQHGKFTRGKGSLARLESATSPSKFTLVHATVVGSNKYLGAMLHRERHGRILRPHRTRGWFWLHEIEAAKKAGLIDNAWISEWMTYTACDCPPPLSGLKDLYELRIRMGKNTAIGKGAKLVYNSAYGKFAQSVGLESGGAPFNNWIYASLTTAGCRTQILNAIATHPEKAKATLMVATDGVYFRSPHPTLELSETKLGAWDHKEKENLTLFKPGVYWDDKARSAIRKGEAAPLKARGVNARDFSKQILKLDKKFEEWEHGRIPGEGLRISDRMELIQAWPEIEFETEFSMLTALQAIRMNNWLFAGMVAGAVVTQSSIPFDKRDSLYREDGIYRSSPLDIKEIDSVSYDKKFGEDDPFGWQAGQLHGINPDGDTINILANMAQVMTGEET